MLIKDAQVPMAALALSHLISTFQAIEDIGHNLNDSKLIHVKAMTVNELIEYLEKELLKCQ